MKTVTLELTREEAEHLLTALLAKMKAAGYEITEAEGTTSA